jgi:uncharacterized membrane protein YidH (DUF202 family)
VSTPPEPLHTDPGLQPERTVMSWGRTLLAVCVASVMFLRWYASAGPLALAPAAVCAVAGLVIHLLQRRRYGTQAAGIVREQVHADVWAVLWMVVLVVSLAGLGLAAMWAGP